MESVGQPWRAVYIDCKQGIEPASRLIHRLGDKISRELLLKQILILKWVMVLCKRHGAGIEPAVDYLRDTVHFFAALRTGDCHRINIRAVKLDIIRAVVRHAL